MNGSGTHYRNTVLALLVSVVATAHPLGNLSANHFTRMQPGAKGVHVFYVLDLGEMPVFELMQKWHVDRASLQDAAQSNAADWLANLSFRENGTALHPELQSARIQVTNSPGDLATIRAELQIQVTARGGRFEFEDRNDSSRAGWREIVIVPGPGAEIGRASTGSADASSELKAIPENAPAPDQRSAWMEWREAPGLVSQSTPPVIVAPAPPVPEAKSGPNPVSPAAKPARQAQSDAISNILRRKTISLPVFAALLALAFWFGALHALEPGHGKTMVAAYLVGARGTPKHAALLGASVTFTHTASVFLLGIATLFISRYVMPDRISRVLGIISGISIVWIGAMLLWRRLRSLRAANHHHAHDHDHGHSRDNAHAHDHAHEQHHAHDHHVHDHHHEHTHHAHVHAHEHSHAVQQHHDYAHARAHAHDHDHGHSHAHDHGQSHAHEHHHESGPYTHTHDGHTHTHVPEGEISVRSLIALGASGGLVPCPSALILLLTAISLGRTALGLVLLCAFSAGLAIVLTLTGMAVLYAKRLIPERRRTNHPVVRYLPVFSAAVIVVIGAVMTGVSLGWIPASRFIG